MSCSSVRISPMVIEQAVILAAGRSTRTYPLSLSTPKPLLQVWGKPLILHNLEALAKIGIRKVTIVTGYRRQQLECFLTSHTAGLQLKFVRQEITNGTGSALFLARKLLTDAPFLVLMGDDLYHESALKNMLSVKINTALVSQVEDSGRFGIFSVTAAAPNEPIDLIEKPSRSASKLANTGAYTLTPSIWEELAQIQPSSRGEIELTDAVKSLIRQSKFRLLLPAPERPCVWQAIGYPWEMLDAYDFLKTRPDCFIHPEARVAPSARLKGRINIERGAVVEDGATLFDCYLGPDSFVGKEAILRSCILGEGSRVEENVSNQDQLGDGEQISTHIAGRPANSRKAQLGAIIGDYAVVGAEAHLQPGVVLWQFAHCPAGSWAEGLIY